MPDLPQTPEQTRAFAEAAKARTDAAALLESLAVLAHEQWSGWMRYMFEKSRKNADGEIVIPKWAVDRWERQAATLYSDLPAEEQESDRDEARRVLALLPDVPTIADLVLQQAEAMEQLIEAAEPLAFGIGWGARLATMELPIAKEIVSMRAKWQEALIRAAVKGDR